MGGARSDWPRLRHGRRQGAFPARRSQALCLCLTEEAIDAMSLAALEGLRPDTLYLSTGGGWSRRGMRAIQCRR